MKSLATFLLGLILGIGICFLGFNYETNVEYAELNQDFELANGGVLKEGTKIKYKASYPEGFSQYSLYLNIGSENNKLSLRREEHDVIPHWIEPMEISGCGSIFESGDEMPVFEGGESDLVKYNYDKIAPIIADNANRTEVLISKLNYSVIIDRNGQVLNPEIISSINDDLKKKIIQELLRMPDWTPGKVRGKSECFKITVPVRIEWE